MKRFVSALTLTALILAAGCQKFDSPSGQVPDTVVNAFNRMYPGATNVQWDAKNVYWVATFEGDATVKSTAADLNSAWYDSSGRWYMTETSAGRSGLPQAVSDAFAASEYATWFIDDIDVIHRNGVETLYVMEVEGQRDGVNLEVELYYSEDGVLIREELEVDDDYEDCIPSIPASSVTEAVEALYPGARIMEVDDEDGLVQVEIVDADRISRDLYFTAALEWVMTETELRYADLPQAIKTAFEASEYAQATVDDVDHYLFAAGDEYYILELDSRPWDDAELKYLPDGTLSSVKL